MLIIVGVWILEYNNGPYSCCG